MSLIKKIISVKIALLEDQLGTVPKNKKIYGEYLANNTTEANKAEEIATVPAPNPDAIDDEMEKAKALKKIKDERGKTTFHKDEEGILIYNYMIQGFLRDAGNTLKSAVGVKNLKSKLEKYVFVSPRKLRPQGLKECNDNLVRPVRGMTPQGPIVSILDSDLIPAGTVFEFELHVLNNAENVTPALLESLLEYGEYSGLGAWRKGGYGAFEVLEFKEIDKSSYDRKEETAKPTRKRTTKKADSAE